MEQKCTYDGGQSDFFAFSSGRPQQHVFQTAGTWQVESASRYEYWVETQIRHITVDRPNAAQRKDFRAKVTSLASATMEVHYAESDAFSASRTRRDIMADPVDELALLFVLEGSLHARLGDHHALSLGPDDFYLYDAGYPQRLEFSRNRIVQFDLCRRKLTAACGGRTPQPAVITDALRRSGLTSMLRLQLSQFPHAYYGLTPQERMVMQSATESLALTVISAALLSDRQATVNGLHLAEAARRYIHLNLDNPEFDTSDIARNLGCSRATLYRAFQLTGVSVAGYIREQRLQKLYQMLRNPLERRPISALAPLCGLYDIPNVSQMFRKRFGMSPSEARRSEMNPAVI
ncbi:helix-turn-helix domain-containing protein [Alcaligenaceae bacterium]|nr:helix-turn-helix domain-containing protein [Alcaligenaceae bacterium]